MYQPPHHREDRLEVQHGLIRAYPLGLLISTGPRGLIADPVPFHLTDAGAGLGVLRAHLARANPHFAQLSGASQCLVVFQGPQAYITPAWYETKRETGKVVPTWNYAIVQAWGVPALRDQATWVRGQIDDLTQENEARRAAPWSANDAPAPFIAAQIRGVVGLEIPIARLEGKWKVSQNRSPADRAGVVRGLTEAGATAMARLVAEARDE
jgi:transcriptional regulator